MADLRVAGGADPGAHSDLVAPAPGRVDAGDVDVRPLVAGRGARRGAHTRPMVQHPLHNPLRDAFVGDLAAAWTYSRHVRAKETPYAFVLYGQESPTQL